MPHFFFRMAVLDIEALGSNNGTACLLNLSFTIVGTTEKVYQF
jgi:hypothetical protein